MKCTAGILSVEKMEGMWNRILMKLQEFTTNSKRNGKEKLLMSPNFPKMKKMSMKCGRRQKKRLLAIQKLAALNLFS